MQTVLGTSTLNGVNYQTFSFNHNHIPLTIYKREPEPAYTEATERLTQ